MSTSSNRSQDPLRSMNKYIPSLPTIIGTLVVLIVLSFVRPMLSNVPVLNKL